MMFVRPTIQGRERSDGGVSSPWGWRDIGFHHGEDYYWLIGDPINSRACYGVGSGQVVEVFWSNSMGWCVTIAHSSSLRSRYCHMASISVAVGQEVSSSSYIGHMGSTGTEARGETHLHFEIWENTQRGWERTDPAPFFAQKPQKRNNSMTTLYYTNYTSVAQASPLIRAELQSQGLSLSTSSPLYALAGDAPGVVLFTHDYDLASALAGTHGGSYQGAIPLIPDSFNIWIGKYLMSGSAGGGAPNLAPVLNAVAEVPQKTRAEFAENPLK